MKGEEKRQCLLLLGQKQFITKDYILMSKFSRTFLFLGTGVGYKNNFLFFLSWHQLISFVLY